MVVRRVIDHAQRLWTLLGLAATLVGQLGPGVGWMLLLGRLLAFAALLSAGWARLLAFYFRSGAVRREVPYGPHMRHRLDVYAPAGRAQGRPVVLFLAGGAWTIGYKGWGAQLGRELRRHGVVMVAADYRNFPQATAPDMLHDVQAALDWTRAHAADFGGDPRRVTVVGQSAGAHLGALAVLERVRLGKGADVAAFVGVSGPYDLEAEAAALTARGLPGHYLEHVMGGDVREQSPLHLLSSPGLAGGGWPRVALIHGDDDSSVSAESSAALAEALRARGVRVALKRYAGVTHTDLILEEPMAGRNRLVRDLLDVVGGKLELAPESSPDDPATASAPLAAGWCVRMARRVNPF